MQDRKLARSPIGAVQITVLALITSTIAAVGVLVALRGLLTKKVEHASGAGYPLESQSTVQPAVDAEMAAEMPQHFSEDLIIPGVTQTGADVEAQDSDQGRSGEGV